MKDYKNLASFQSKTKGAPEPEYIRVIISPHSLFDTSLAHFHSACLLDLFFSPASIKQFRI